MKPNEDIRLLYIDLFCGAGGTSTGVENAVINGKKIAKVWCEAIVPTLSKNTKSAVA